MIELFLAVISGLGVGLAFLYPELSFLVWFSLVPLFFLLSDNFSFKKAFLFFLFGAVYYGTAIHWVSYVTFLGFIFLVSYLALFYVLFYFLGRFFIRRPLCILSIPAVWIVIEFLKEIIWCGFGWANLGYSQFRNIYIIQIADIGGTKLISFFILFVNFVIWELLVHYRKKQRKSFFKYIIPKSLLIVAVFTVLTSYSFFRLKSPIVEDKINVSLIQPNILQRHLYSESEKENALMNLSILAKKAPEESLVIFSEAAWPYTLGEKNTERLNEFIRRINRDVLIGVINRRKQNYYNSAFLFDPDGQLTEIYDKIILVPFGEYVPLRKYLTFIDVLNQIGDITAGSKITEFSYQNKKFSVLICFEDIVPIFAARAARAKDFLVNITDDSWFRGDPEATQHLAIMVLRAVENRIPIVRAANTGISGWVSAEGRVEKLEKDSNSLFVRAKENFEIALRSKRSFYNRYPEWLMLFSFIVLAATFFCKKDKS